MTFCLSLVKTYSHAALSAARTRNNHPRSPVMVVSVARHRYPTLVNSLVAARLSTLLSSTTKIVLGSPSHDLAPNCPTVLELGTYGNASRLKQTQRLARDPRRFPETGDYFGNTHENVSRYVHHDTVGHNLVCELLHHGPGSRPKRHVFNRFTVNEESPPTT